MPEQNENIEMTGTSFGLRSIREIVADLSKPVAKRHQRIYPNRLLKDISELQDRINNEKSPRKRKMKIKPREEFIKTIRVCGIYFWIYGTYSALPEKGKPDYDCYAVDTDGGVRIGSELPDEAAALKVIQESF